ncbi:MAG TPA: hypothetical protein PL081_01355, partial [Pseudomonadales bacterium]|nr:hypothetical protein [Pseudomonadales bacterium]
MPVDPSTPTLSRTRLRLAALMLLLLAATLVVIGILSRANAEAELKAATEAQAIPTVAVLLPIKSKQASEIELPGRLDPRADGITFHRVPVPDYPLAHLNTYVLSLASQLAAVSSAADLDLLHLHYA